MKYRLLLLSYIALSIRRLCRASVVGTASESKLNNVKSDQRIQRSVRWQLTDSERDLNSAKRIRRMQQQQQQQLTPEQIAYIEEILGHPLNPNVPIQWGQPANAIEPTYSPTSEQINAGGSSWQTDGHWRSNSKSGKSKSTKGKSSKTGNHWSDGWSGAFPPIEIIILPAPTVSPTGAMEPMVSSAPVANDGTTTSPPSRGPAVNIVPGSNMPSPTRVIEMPSSMASEGPSTAPSSTPSITPSQVPSTSPSVAPSALVSTIMPSGFPSSPSFLEPTLIPVGESVNSYNCWTRPVYRGSSISPV